MSKFAYTILGGLLALGIYNQTTTPSKPLATGAAAATKPDWQIDAEKAEREVQSQKSVVLATRNGPVVSAKDMINETGCASKASDEKKADIFKAKYKSHRVIATGEIALLDNGQLNLKLLASTLTFDVRIEMADKRATYDLQKGSTVTVEFTATDQGGCVLAHSGNDGVLK
jgi:hypothetical protein